MSKPKNVRWGPLQRTIEQAAAENERTFSQEVRHRVRRTLKRDGYFETQDENQSERGTGTPTVESTGSDDEAA